MTDNRESFTSRHFGVLITSIISLAAVLVSAAQVYVARIDKEKELQLASLEKDRVWKLQTLRFVVENMNLIFSENQKHRERIRGVMLVTLPPEVTIQLFASLETTSEPHEAKVWTEGLEKALALKGIRVAPVVTKIPGFVGKTVKTKFLVTNTSQDTYMIRMIKVEGKDSAEFRISHGCNRISPGKACSIVLAYKPERPGSHSAQIRIVTDVGSWRAATVYGFTASPPTG